MLLALLLMFPQDSSAAVARMLAQVASGLDSPDTPAQERAKVAREAAKRKDVLAWGKAVMPWKFHLPFCDELHGHFVKIRGEAFTDTEAPRDHAKTSIKCNLIPLFQALEEPETFDYYLNVQSTLPKALAVNLGIKLELEQNEVIAELYGEQVGDDKWTDQLFVTRRGVVFHAIGTGQSIRGTNYRNRRPNYAIIDDLYDEEDINNPESTEKKNAWFWSTLYPALAEDRRTSVHVQGTATNDVDLLKQLSQRAGVTYRSFSSVDDQAKTALWPALKTYEQRCAQRDLMPSVIFAREYQNERRDDSSSIVKPSWLQGWEFDPASLRFGRDHRVTAVTLDVDPSIGAKVENDKTGMAVVIRSQRSDAKGADYWITHLVNEHLSLDARILRMQDILDRQPQAQRITKARIEAVAGFKDFAAEARRRLTGVGVEEVDVVKDKISVLESKSWHFENRRVHISTAVPKPLRDELFFQLTVNHPQNDDLRDAVLLALDSTDVSMWQRLG